MISTKLITLKPTWTRVIGTWSLCQRLRRTLYSHYWTFITSVYRQPTFSGVYTNYNSFSQKSIKHDSVLSSLDYLQYVRAGSWYTTRLNTSQWWGRTRILIASSINQFIMHGFVVIDATPTVKDSKTFQLCLSYLGPSISRTERSVNKLFEQYLPKCRVKVITKATVRLSSQFGFKDKIPRYLSAGVIYKFACGTCNGTYIGKTKRHLKTR